MLSVHRAEGAMKNHDDDHPAHDQLRHFLAEHGSEILEVIQRQNLTGVDDATRFQRALAELSVRWGVLPSDQAFSEFLADGAGEDDEPA
jgi:hypothetical protein